MYVGGEAGSSEREATSKLGAAVVVLILGIINLSLEAEGGGRWTWFPLLPCRWGVGGKEEAHSLAAFMNSCPL